MLTKLGVSNWNPLFNGIILLKITCELFNFLKSLNLLFFILTAFCSLFQIPVLLSNEQLFKKKGNFVYYFKKLLSTRHCNTLLCFIIVIFVQWVLVQLLNFRLSLRKRRWQKWKALAAQVISVTNFQPAYTVNLLPLARLL